MFANHQNDTSQFAARKAAATIQNHRVEPELGAVRVPFHMDVRRFGPIAREEETPIGTDAQHSGHDAK